MLLLPANMAGRAMHCTLPQNPDRSSSIDAPPGEAKDSRTPGPLTSSLVNHEPTKPIWTRRRRLIKLGCAQESSV